jgi:secondary thiamine-phosphate synthase enzyme
MVVQETLSVRTPGRGTHDLTREIMQMVSASGVRQGLCNIFVLHTSASLLLCENADPLVRQDLEAFMSRLVPDGDPVFRHMAEGPDDMPAHVRSVLTQSSLTIPVKNGMCMLGTWQGIYLWEHRLKPHHRQITVTVYGE